MKRLTCAALCVLTATLARAQGNEPVRPAPPAAPPQPADRSAPADPVLTGVTVAFGLGVGMAFGDLYSAPGSTTPLPSSASLNRSLDAHASRLYPISIAIGYRPIPLLSFDVALGFAPLSVTGCSSSCSGADESLGGELRFHFRADRFASPWFSLGFGYERFLYGTGGLFSGYFGVVDLDGLQSEFQVGCDLRLSHAWTLGPYVGLRVGSYGHIRTTDGYRAGAFAGDIPDSNQAFHEWLIFGIRGVFTHLPRCIWPGAASCR